MNVTTTTRHQWTAEIPPGFIVRRETRSRRTMFAKGMKLAMNTTLGQDADEVHKVLGKQGVSFRLAEQALQLAGPQSSYSVFAIVGALTRIAGRYENAGDRLVLDQKAATLLSLAA